jgi:hypothetical protein
MRLTRLSPRSADFAILLLLAWPDCCCTCWPMASTVSIVTNRSRRSTARCRPTKGPAPASSPATTEAGAIDLYGPALDLPLVISGVNSYWYRGYGDPPPSNLIVLGADPATIRRAPADCTPAGRVSNRHGVENEETRNHPEIYLCRNLRVAWPAFWPKIRRYGRATGGIGLQRGSTISVCITTPGSRFSSDCPSARRVMLV